MASLGKALMGQVLGRSDAEEAFRPWWTKIRDFTMYGLAILAVTLLPVTPALASPVDCTPWNPTNPANPVQRKYARKLCVMTKIDWFVLHFPYLLLCGALLLFAIEQIFLRVRRSNKVQEKFFDVLVSLGIVEGKEEKTREHHPHTGDQLESRRLLVDLRERLSSSSSFFYSFLLVQAVEFVFAAAIAGFIIFKSASPNIGGLELTNATFNCEVNRQQFKCSGHPTYFYKASMVLSSTLFLLHGLTTLYSLLWTLCPCLQGFSGMMMGLELSGDSRLLVSLLAEGSGAGVAVRALTALQPAVMLDLLEPGQLLVESWPSTSENLSVDLLSTDGPKLHLTTFISVRNKNPPGPGMEIALKTGALYQLMQVCRVSYLVEVPPPCTCLLGESSRDRLVFGGLTEGEDLAMTVTTMVDGRPVASRTVEVNTNEMGNTQERDVGEFEKLTPFQKTLPPLFGGTKLN